MSDAVTSRKPSRRLGSYGRLGVFLFVVGGILAIDTMANLAVLYRLWPLLVTILGSGFVGIHLRRGRREPAYVGIGAYLIGFSFLALYCSFTTWSHMAMLWPAFIGLLGLSFCAGYLFGGRNRLLLLAGLLLVSLAAVFLFVFGIDSNLWWTAVILPGLSFLAFDRARHLS